MNIPSLSSLSSLSALGGKIPDNMKTISVTRRHIIAISHAVPANRVLDILPALPSSLALDTLKIEGQSCAILQTILTFNDDFHYTPLPLPNLDFWQLDYGVLVRRNAQIPAPNATAPNAESSTQYPGATTPYAPSNPSPTLPIPNSAAPNSAIREAGIFVIQSFLGTRAAWGLQRAVASEADFADFNVILRGSTTDAYSPLIADINPGDGTPPTQFSVRGAAQMAIQAPFANAEKMSDFLMRRPTIFSKTSVGDKFVALKSEGKSLLNPLPGEAATVGGEIKEARFGVWEKLNLLNASEMRRPYSILIQPEMKTVLQSATLL